MMMIAMVTAMRYVRKFDVIELLTFAKKKRIVSRLLTFKVAENKVALVLCTFSLEMSFSSARFVYPFINGEK